MKTTKLFFAVALLFCVAIVLKAAFPADPLSGGGAGTQQDPYRIATADDLNAVRLAVSTAGGVGVGVAYYELTANIGLSSISNWAGLGAYNNAFRGNFNGNGYTVSGVKAGTVSERQSTLTSGFFGFINGATISNLHVDVAFYTIFAPTATATGPTAGGLVNTTTGTGNNIINNCKVTGVVDVLGVNSTKELCYSFRKKGDIRNGKLLNFPNVLKGYPFKFLGHTFNDSECAYISGCYTLNNKHCLTIQNELSVYEKGGYNAKAEYRKAKTAKEGEIIKPQFIRTDWEVFNFDLMLLWYKVNNNPEFRDMLM